VLAVWEHAAAERGIRYEELVSDLPVPLAELRDPRGWIDWNVLVELVERFEQLTSPAEIIRIGRAAIKLEVVGPMQRVAGLALNPRHLYRVAMQWQLPLIHRNLLVKYHVVAERSVRIEISIPPHFRGSSAWFRVLQGGLEAMPAMSGLPAADVRAEITPHHAVYHVSLPEQPRRLLSRLLAGLRSPASTELERQVDELRRIDRERAHLEDALRERERRLANLIANLSGMVYRVRADDFGFEFASERSCELTGYEPEELVSSGMSSFALVHPDDVEGLREKRLASFGAQQPASDEYRMRTRDGETRWVLDVACGVYDATGRLTGSEGFITDVTARKRLEEELAHAQRVEGIGRLAGGIAHDFNNLLTVILGSAELAQRALPKNSSALLHLDQVLAASDRAAALTQQLLAFARKQVIEPRVVDLNTLVLSMSVLMRRTLVEDIELSNRLSPDLWLVEVDPGRFEQVLLNLAINARDAMPTGGTLTMETANMVLERPAPALPGLLPGHYVMLSVSDTGIGMTTEVQRRAFEPFFTTKEVGKGTGLGLASAHGIVRQAHGHVFLSSELARGTTLRIYLPRSLSQESTVESVRPIATSGRGHERVLVVEDHDMVREMVVSALAGQGYSVLAAPSGTRALELVESLESELDLLVADIVMPRMSGLELAAQLLASRPALPVLYMSGYSEQIASSQQRAISSHALLHKPFTSTELVNKVRDVLERAQRDSGVVGPLMPAASNAVRLNQP
jgi:PAS domain S-box-containing protein